MSATSMSQPALADVVRTIMAAGAACFTDKLARRQVAVFETIPDALGDFPQEFLQLRPAIVDDLRTALDAMGGQR